MLQDVIIMHNQERALAQHPKGWRGFGLATPSDTGVDALWHWLQAAGGDVPWAGGQSSLQDLTPRLSREVSCHPMSACCTHEGLHQDNSAWGYKVQLSGQHRRSQTCGKGWRMLHDPVT